MSIYLCQVLISWMTVSLSPWHVLSADIMLSLVIEKFSYVSVVARGEAVGTHAPQFFFPKSKNRSVLNVENKILFPERFQIITFVLLSSFFNVHSVMHNNIKQPKTKNKPEIELTMITYYDNSERWNVCWFQDTETVGFLFCNWRCKCYTLFNVHWFAETV